MNEEPKLKVGRLMLRREGEMWKAYYTLDELDEADLATVYLGSIAISAVSARPKAKEAFLALMRQVVADFIEDATGMRPMWEPPVQVRPDVVAEAMPDDQRATGPVDP